MSGAPTPFLVAADVVALAPAQSDGQRASGGGRPVSGADHPAQSGGQPTQRAGCADRPALGGDFRVLLVERGHDPYRGRWALPGGFVEPGEVTEQAARRELAEETSIHDFTGRFELLGVYGPTGRRDPRGEIVSVTYLAIAREALPVAGGDDAAAAFWVTVREALEPGRLAFDHERILADALARVGIVN